MHVEFQQALTYCDHKHGTEAEWAPWMHAEFWQSSTHSLWSWTSHRSRMSTMDACKIMTIKHLHSLTTNMAQKLNKHDGCMLKSDNQVLTPFDHKHDTEAEWALWMHVITDNEALTSFDHKHGKEAEWAPWMNVEFWKSSTHLLWSQTWHRSRVSTVDVCRILTMKHSHTMITNMAQKQN